MFDVYLPPFLTLSNLTGQGKTPSNFLRQKDWDLGAFPRHHPKGVFGLHHERKQKVTDQMYFQQRIMNRDERFSTDISYIFAAQQFIERAKIESQISIAGRKGVTQSSNGIKKVFEKKVQTDFSR